MRARVRRAAIAMASIAPVAVFAIAGNRWIG